MAYPWSNCHLLKVSTSPKVISPHSAASASKFSFVMPTCLRNFENKTISSLCLFSVLAAILSWYSLKTFDDAYSLASCPIERDSCETGTSSIAGILSWCRSLKRSQIGSDTSPVSVAIYAQNGYARVFPTRQRNKTAAQ